MEKFHNYEIKQFIGPAIRKARNQLGLTAEGLSLDAGKNDKYIGRIERGEIKNIKLDTLNKICNALEMPTSELLAIAEKLERDSLNN